MLSCIVIVATVVVTEKSIEPSGPFRAVIASLNILF